MAKLSDYNQGFILNNKKLYLKISLLIFLVVGAFVYINNHLNFHKYLKIPAIFQDETVSVVLKADDVAHLLDQKKILYRKEPIAYEVDEIKGENIIVGDKYFKEVLLLVKDIEFVENETMEFNLVLEESKIFTYLLNLIKGG